ncbi:hypothetical protein F4694_001263 [Bacillus niacini]|uniref:Uncharacterized protein n=1 Tax=Neobacillus niacini TaxID=86668 RepID=A0A852T9F1_9BACI|nr:hypothetical protein [Neobacillus niacini]NYE04519.1 hypothetical protein [Neobacillus niacini]
MTEADISLYYENKWKPKRVLFRDQVRCIASMYTYLLGRFQTERTEKITINCVEKTNDNALVKTTLDGFTKVSVELDIDSYFLLSNYEKKRVILEKINGGVTKVANEFSWDIELFNRISYEIIKNDYVNEYVWKQKTSPDKKFKAEVYCQHDIDFFTISIL